MAITSVVVADDEFLNRDLLEEIFQRMEITVRTTKDGVQALKALEDQPADLLLTDIRMPIMDGIALALSAKRERPELTILLMTGYADQRERARNLEAIVTDVLTKPFSLQDARAAVAQALGG